MRRWLAVLAMAVITALGICGASALLGAHVRGDVQSLQQTAAPVQTQEPVQEPAAAPSPTEAPLPPAQAVDVVIAADAGMESLGSAVMDALQPVPDGVTLTLLQTAETRDSIKAVDNGDADFAAVTRTLADDALAGKKLYPDDGDYAYDTFRIVGTLNGDEDTVLIASNYLYDGMYESVVPYLVQAGLLAEQGAD